MSLDRKEYLWHAAHCRELADRAGNLPAEFFLELAEKWELLATELGATPAHKPNAQIRCASINDVRG